MNTWAIQPRVASWVTRCFGKEMFLNKHERARRFLEEAVELAQAVGVPQKAVTRIVTHVYDRPAGSVPQEIGGVALTLLALCERLGINFGVVTEQELTRVEALPEDHFRQRQAMKSVAGIALMPTGTD